MRTRVGIELSRMLSHRRDRRGAARRKSDRRLAIVDGRIVPPGDDVGGARVIDITPTQVLLRDTDGRSRELTLSAAVERSRR